MGFLGGGSGRRGAAFSNINSSVEFAAEVRGSVFQAEGSLLRSFGAIVKELITVFVFAIAFDVVFSDDDRDFFLASTTSTLGAAAAAAAFGEPSAFLGSGFALGRGRGTVNFINSCYESVAEVTASNIR